MKKLFFISALILSCCLTLNTSAKDIGSVTTPLEIEPIHDLDVLPPLQDLRFGYKLTSQRWQKIEMLTLEIKGIRVRFRETDLSCHPKDYVEAMVLGDLERMGDTDLTEDRTYISRTKSTLRIIENLREPRFDLTALNNLPNGMILSMQFIVGKAWVTNGSTEYPVNLQHWQQTEGIKLSSSTPIPVCSDYLTAVQLNFDADQLLPEDHRAATLLKNAVSDPGRSNTHISTVITAPKVLYSDQEAELIVPGVVRATFPQEAVEEPVMIRLKNVHDLKAMRRKEVDLSSDPLFNSLMEPVGEAFDFMPDAMMFNRPIQLGLRSPEYYRITEATLKGLGKEGVNRRIIKRIQSIIGSDFDDEARFIDTIARLTEGKYVTRILTHSEKTQRYSPDALALYTYSPEFRIWTPDMPRLHNSDLKIIERELDRVISAKEASSNLSDHFPPDYSAVDWEKYGALRFNDVNKFEDNGFLMISTNHFCIKSLFADLNVDYSDRGYPPLLDGTLDDMCQDDGFGWVRDSNEDVHCGGSLPSSHDLRVDARKTRRAIDPAGIAVRFRVNTRNYFEDQPACPNLDSTYCYDLYDFEDDVRWGINVWREAINRNPDTSYTERFMVNCWHIDDEDEVCHGDKIDVGIYDINDPDTPAHAYGKNFTIDTAVMNDVLTGQFHRAELRSRIIHELGHVLGLSHWAGPGTLMSYQGRRRRNEHRLNICGPFTQSELGGWGTTFNPTATDCSVPGMWARMGTPSVDRTVPSLRHPRINRVTCTDTKRVRNLVNHGPDWSDTQPLQCEIIAEQTEYSVLEVLQFDLATNELYYTLDFDLRFEHCGLTAGFDAVELEILGVAPENRSHVFNLYDEAYEISPISQGDDGLYTVHVSLDSRKLISTDATLDPATGVTTYPSFSEYQDGRNNLGGAGVGRSYRNLALAIRAYVDTHAYPLRFVAASTGLLRSPFLAPVSLPIRFGIEDILKGGVSDADNPLITVFEDHITSPDLFPYATEPMKKPNVPGVLYISLPPQAHGSTPGYEVSFGWEVFDQQYDTGAYGPMRIWVDRVDIARLLVPTIEDWDRANGAIFGFDFIESHNYTGEPGVPQDTCLNLYDSFLLPTLSEEPLQEATAPNGEEIDAWELYRVRVNYDHINYLDPATGPVCNPALDVCSPLSTCVPEALTGTRYHDYWVSIAGPTGGFVIPRGYSSVCLFDASVSGERYTVAGNLQSIQVLSEAFPDWDFEVRIRGAGKVREPGGGRCANKPYDSRWLSAEDLPDDGILSYRPKWQNNCHDEAYTVVLQYRHRAPGEADWTVVDLDTLRLRIDADNNDCDSDDFEYERECSPWDARYACPESIDIGS